MVTIVGVERESGSVGEAASGAQGQHQDVLSGAAKCHRPGDRPDSSSIKSYLLKTDRSILGLNVRQMGACSKIGKWL